MRRTRDTTADRGVRGPGAEVPDAASSHVPDGGSEASEPGSGRKPETYRSPLALLIWWVWLAFAVANLIDLAVQGHDHLSAVAAAVLLLVTGIAYAAALRPRVIASGQGITVRNVLRDHQVPWLAVTKIDLGDLLRVHCTWPDPAGTEQPGPRSASPPTGGQQRSKVVQAWAIQSSRRARTIAELRRGTGRGGLAPRSSGGFARAPEPSGAGHREAERIARALEERARTERAHGGALAPGAGPVAAWHWPSVAALALPVLLLIIVIFA